MGRLLRQASRLNRRLSFEKPLRVSFREKRTGSPAEERVIRMGLLNHAAGRIQEKTKMAFYRNREGLMHRFYAEIREDGLAPLSPEDAKHALRVLRLAPGAEVELICAGRRFRARLLENAVLAPQQDLPSTESALRITLFQGIPKGDKMDWIVQKAVEIGVARIVPVSMERCVVRLNPQDAEKKQARWNRIAREAGKQSGRCLLPEVALPVSLEGLHREASGLDCCVVPWEEAREGGPAAFVQSHPKISSLGILIGPEGGISVQEIDHLRGVFRPITLGPRILRTETAGLAAAAAMLALYGEME